MIRIQQIKLEPGHTAEMLEKKILSALKIKKEQLESWKIVKRSIDARKKPAVKIVYVIDVTVKEEKKVMRGIGTHTNIQILEETKYRFVKSGTKKLSKRPIIVGSGPAGLFCGLFLARHGYCPLILERGEDVDTRTQTVANFWNGGSLNPASNVQFGEGGAGTFSDGKLNTLVKDEAGRNRKVLETFVEAGAPEEILFTNKAHIGTDLLRLVVKKMRKMIEAAGGEVRFLNQVTELRFQEVDGKRCIQAVVVNGTEQIYCETLVLAIGHSARDTFAMLYENGLFMSAKAFAVGIRIEHPQSQINLAQYGMEHNPYLQAADYKVTYQASNGRNVYSFCMCPGGYIVNASSEENRIAINGMSYYKRDGKNANSALIVSVTPKDYPGESALAGIEYQRRLEEAAYLAGKGQIPVQMFGDFEKNRKTEQLFGVTPCIKGAYTFANLREALPIEIGNALIEGIHAFAEKISGYDRADSVLSGVESRTSSPVRIWRNEEMEHTIAGIYPCGEGAGYAGGITSAAMDGIKVAEAIARKYAPMKF